MEILLALIKWVILNTHLSHQILNVKLTLKQDEAKNERRSLSTTFSINRRRGSMCELGAVLKRKKNRNELGLHCFQQKIKQQKPN